MEIFNISDNFIELDNTVIKEGLDLSEDFTIPDYISDIRKVIYSDCKVILRDSYITPGCTKFIGEVDYDITILCDDDTIRNTVYSGEFEITSSKEIDLDNVNITCKLDYYNIKPQSKRKICCKCRVNISGSEVERVLLAPQFIGDYTNEDILSVQTKEVTAKNYIKRELKYADLQSSGDITLGANENEVYNIIYTNLNCCIEEIKNIEGRIALRGTAQVNMLYEDENAGYHKVSKTMPFSEFINEDINDEELSCCIYIKDIKASCTNNELGEMKLIEIDYTYDIFLKCLKNNQVKLVEDAYSTCKDTECSFKNIELKTINSCFNSMITQSKSIENDNYKEINSLVDCYCKVSSTDMDFTDGKMIISGECYVDILYSTKDSSEKYSYNSEIVPFKFTRDIDTSVEHSCDYNISVIKCEASLTDESVEISVYLCINGCVFDKCDNKIVDKIEFGKENINCDSPVTLYYPQKGETLWEIAKKYKRTEQSIIDANGIKGNNLENTKVLLLPRAKNNCIFNKIV